MNPDASSPFVTTRWSRVLAARGDSENARAALSDLCAAYYDPVVAFIARVGCGPDDPRDVAHEFFAALLRQGGPGGVVPGRGRFRSYLLAAVRHHLANRRRHAARTKRGGDVEHQPLPSEGDTDPGTPLAAPAADWEALFDREWALAIVERSLSVMALEAEASGAAAEFAALRPWLSAEATPEPQSAAALRLGMSEGAVKVAIHRLRRRFREQVRSEIRQTLPDDADAEGELRHLIAALAVRAATPG
ncbi:MAG: sigma-70 family RNA polymerase sigma factor [Verrucomicrobia bacterium]|nr:sigma-70 family RNA polymerase sigma factor [Verrucomicrobiota bacterium]